MRLSFILGLLVVTSILGCAPPYKLPADYLDARAQYGFDPINSGEETNPELRGLILSSIRADMYAIGKHPAKAIETSELMSLESIAPSNSSGNSRANYSARVRLNYQRHWIDVDYFVFEREGVLKVRKTSLGL